MEFEILKKSHKKQIIIGALAICVIGGALTFATTRAKYKLTEDLELAKGTINYKPYDFKIMAMYKSEDGTNYTEINDRMPSSGYIINESKSYCNLTSGNKDTSAVLKTIEGNHIISNLAKGDRCYLYFDKKLPSASETILANVTPKSTTPTFSNAATTDEGVYSVSDGMYGGTSYYWRGAVTNNYVKFADKCWRIVRINGDGSIRLIYDGTTCHANGSNSDSIAKTSIVYNSSYNQSYYVGWTYSSAQRPSTANPQTSGTASNAKTQLESWYSSNITGTNATKVADGKYCNDRTSITSSGGSYTWAATGSTFYYGAYHRINTGAPTLSCPNGDIYTLKVGLITADEVMYAGGKFANNTSYYLYNGQNYWTMSPSHWENYGNACVFVVRGSDGNLRNTRTDLVTDLRPVINLKADVTFSGGSGTLDNPYIVS